MSSSLRTDSSEVAQLAEAHYAALQELNDLRAGTGHAPSLELISFAVDVGLLQKKAQGFLLKIAGAPVRRLPPQTQVWLAELIAVLKRSEMLRAKLEMVPLREIRERETVQKIEIMAVRREVRDLPAGVDAAERAARLASVKEVIVRYWPRHWPSLEAELAVAATLLLKDVDQALALLIIGESGEGKGTTLDMFEGADDVILLDTLTIPSLLSGSAEGGRLESRMRRGRYFES